MFTRSGLFRGHVFKVKVLEIMSSKPGFTEGQVIVIGFHIIDQLHYYSGFFLCFYGNLM